MHAGDREPGVPEIDLHRPPVDGQRARRRAAGRRPSRARPADSVRWRRSRKRPSEHLARRAWRAARGSAASTAMPLVSAASMIGVAPHASRRRSLVTAAAERTLRRLRTARTAASGSLAASPRNVCPGVTVSRLVPSSFSSATRPALLESEIAEHGDHRGDADRHAERRQCGAQATRAQSDARHAQDVGGSRRLRGAAPDASARCGAPTPRHASARSSSWIRRPSRSSTRRGQRRGDLAVVGDHDAPSCPARSARAAARGCSAPVARVEVAGRLVGEHDRRRADERAGDRHALALAARTAAPRCARARWLSPTRSSAARGRPAALARGRARVEQAVGDVLERAVAPRAGGTAGRRSRCAARAARRGRGRTPRRRRLPAIRTTPLVARSSVPMMCSSVDLPEPEGPTIAHSSPSSTVRFTPRSASHAARVALDDVGQLEHGARRVIATRSRSALRGRPRLRSGRSRWRTCPA